MYDIIIVGAGTAGLTAALYANRAGLHVLIIEKGIYGGQIISTPVIENYPALPDVSGFDYVQTLFDQAVTKFETPIVYEQIEHYELEGEVKKITTATGSYEGKTVILAAGSEHRALGCAGEEDFKGKGVSYCATCDGACFRRRDVAVAGGGNTALQDAKYLAVACKQVYLIHRRDAFRANAIEVESALRKENIIPVYNAVIDEILGDKVVNSVRLQDILTGEQREIAVNAVFVAIGLNPNSAGLPVELDESGYIIAGEDCRTNLAGVFAAGDIRTKKVRQLVTAAADGAVSAQMAQEYLA